MSAPETSFYVTGGTLRYDAPSYVERQADREVFEGLLAGEFCYVLTPRQMGKSSLMVRTASRLREQGVNVIALDLTAIGQNLTSEQWYDGLLARMGRQLKLDEELERFWREHERLGPCQRLFMAVRDVVLPRRPGPLAIFVDEIDSVRSLPFSTDEFFAAMREYYNRRAEDPELNRVAFCLLGVATPSDLVRDTRTTPFNIGRRIELYDFTEAEAAPLAQGLQRRPPGKDEPQTPRTAAEAEAAALHADRLLKRILHWTSGHPYLTQRFCQAVAGHACAADLAEVDRLCDELFLSSKARERDDNLLFVRDRLLRSESDLQSLLDLYENVHRDKRVADDDTSPLVSVLRLSGIVKAEGGLLRNRNRIYSRVFDRDWIRAHRPGAELRRQRAAFYRGVRATTVAAVVVAALAFTAVIAVKQTTNARRALAQAYVSQAEASLVSRLQGQRFNALAAIERAAPICTNHAALRNVALAALALPDLRPGPAWPGWPEGTTCATVSPDLATYARGDSSGNISVRRTRGDTEIAALRGGDAPAAWMTFSPNGSLLGVLRGQGSRSRLIVWDWRRNRIALETPDTISGQAVDFSPDSHRVAVGLRNGSIEIHSVDGDDLRKQPITRLAGELPRPPTQLRFHPSAPRLAACSSSGLNLRIWDLDTGRLTNSFFYPDPVRSLAWNPHGAVLAAGTEKGCICLWDLGARQPSQKPWKEIHPGHEGEVAQLAFSHSGDLLASFGTDKALRLWVPATGRRLTHSPQNEEIEAVSFSADDRHLGLYRSGAKLQTWEVNPARAYRPLVDPAGVADEIHDIDLSPDGEILAVATSKGAVLWDAQSGRQLGMLPSAPIRSVAFPASSDALLTCGKAEARRWPITRSGSAREPRLHLGPAKSWSLPEGLGEMAVAPDGKTAAVIRPQTILLFDPAGSEQSTSLPTETFYDALALGPGGHLLAARVSNREEIHFWNVRQRARVPASAAINSGQNFRFSPDGRWFCTVAGGEYALHEVGSWSRGPGLARKRSANQPGVMAFSGDGRLLALAVAPSSIELVGLPNGESLGRLDGPDDGALVAMAFSRDGRILAAAGRENLAMLWDLGDLATQLSALNLAGRLPVHPTPARVTRSVQMTIDLIETNRP